MSYDIDLLDPVTKDIIQFKTPLDIKGGIYAVGGTTQACINITYNYANIFQKVFGNGGVRNLYGMSAVDSIPLLEMAIMNLGDDVDEDYWVPTEGNAKKPLVTMLTMAKMNPDGIWDGD